jgi:hypothetical protein
LNSAADNTTAGRRFTAALSVKGKGTTSTSNGLKVTVDTLVVRRIPLVLQGRLNRRGKT